MLCSRACDETLASVREIWELAEAFWNSRRREASTSLSTWYHRGIAGLVFEVRNWNGNSLASTQRELYVAVTRLRVIDGNVPTFPLHHRLHAIGFSEAQVVAQIGHQSLDFRRVGIVTIERMAQHLQPRFHLRPDHLLYPQFLEPLALIPPMDPCDYVQIRRDADGVLVKDWTRMTANMSLGAYEVFTATGEIPKPNWPEESFQTILKIAFKDRMISDREHPVLKRLRGEA